MKISMKNGPGLILGVALAACIAYALVDISSTSFNTQPKASTKPEYLFVIHAHAGRLTAQNNQFQLALSKPIINYFTDRPYRQAGHLKEDKYLTLWKAKYQDNFAADPPNASLTGLNYRPDQALENNPNSEVNTLLVIKGSTWDPNQQALVMNVAALKDARLAAGKLDDVTLFVDGSGEVPLCGDMC